MLESFRNNGDIYILFFYHSSSASCTWKLNSPSRPEDLSFTQPITQTALPFCMIFTYGWIFHMKQTDVYIGQKANFPYYLSIGKTITGFQSIFLYKKVFQIKITKPIKNIHFFDIIKTQMWRDGCAQRFQIGLIVQPNTWVLRQ